MNRRIRNRTYGGVRGRENLFNFPSYSIPGSEGQSHQGTAAAAGHKADGTEDHEKRHNDINGGEGLGTHKVRDENTVHNSVDGRENHHDDRRKREPQEFFVGKMVGK